MEKLICACTWGDEDMVGKILRSCYVSETMALPALAEAVRRNFLSVVTLILNAGVTAWKIDPISNKNAFHVACEMGSEDLCIHLLESILTITDKEKIYLKNGNGRNGFEILRDNDMCGIAKRVEKKVNEWT